MMQAIGETAGKVYRALETKGAMRVSQLKTETQADTFTLHAAIGWLAREGKIDFQKKGRSIVIALR